MQSGVVISMLVILLIPLIVVNANPIDTLSPLSVPQLQGNESKNNSAKVESPLVNSQGSTGPDDQPDGSATGSKTIESATKADQDGDVKSDDAGSPTDKVGDDPNNTNKTDSASRKGDAGGDNPLDGKTAVVSDDGKTDTASRNGDAGGDNPLDGKTAVVSDDGKTDTDSRNGDAGGDNPLDGKSAVVSDDGKTDTDSRNGDAGEDNPLDGKTAVVSDDGKTDTDSDDDDDPVRQIDESRQDLTDPQNSFEEHDSGRNVEVAVVTDNEEGGSHFFAFILTAMFCTAAVYLLYHNKRKVAAFVFPGAQRRTGMRHRSGYNANYERLQSKPDGKTYVF